ncbi:MAG: hypothetical protein PWR12_695 [Eubacteriaceae bacterium]|jgi:hypothetical protein|nr:hypothetical protein [Eubacteriaceae bacterium]MDK2904619.1 hypothetical protein [Eubacteriaceae bacterium]MDK2935347.1 hypothetical protein [Eubacteriaceae bacterium]MDK2961607.1 hypothetical protein [Eubacteriaceae bacterium]
MIKINISYEDEKEVQPVLELLEPMIDNCKVKRSNHDKPYKHIYITEKHSKPHNNGV